MMVVVIYLAKKSMNDKWHILCHPKYEEQTTYLFPSNRHVQKCIKKFVMAPRWPCCQSNMNCHVVHILSIVVDQTSMLGA